MPKFFVNNEQVNIDRITITGEDVNHIKNVLRLKENDEIMVCNKETRCNYKCIIIENNIDNVVCKVSKKIENNYEDKIHISIFQALPKADKMELIIQKCTELGVRDIVPVQMERCVVKLDSKTESKKIERWRKIAESASKQCGRNDICNINNVTDIKSICKNVNNYDILLVPYENEKKNSFKDALESLKQIQNPRIAIVIGPEGGFCKEEIDFLKQNGGTVITLGNRIIRTETVALAMTSAIMYEFGELG